MIQKVCGLTTPENIALVNSFSPTHNGFIAYVKSPRYVSPNNYKDIAKMLHESEVKAVGVFVNADISEIATYMEIRPFDVLQLHGDETPAFCEAVKKEFPSQLWKAIGVKDKIPDEEVQPFQHIADALLFDTKSDAYGGTGKTFPWDSLRTYSGGLPFLLSGGITPENYAQAYATFLDLEKCIGLDINSGFEKSPGIKCEEKLKRVMHG